MNEDTKGILIVVAVLLIIVLGAGGLIWAVENASTTHYQFTDRLTSYNGGSWLYFQSGKQVYTAFTIPIVQIGQCYAVYTSIDYHVNLVPATGCSP